MSLTVLFELHKHKKGAVTMKKGLYCFSLLIAFVIVIVFSPWNLVSADLRDGLVLHVTFEEEEPVDSSPDPTEISVFAGDLGQDEGKVGKAGVFDSASALSSMESTNANAKSSSSSRGILPSFDEGLVFKTGSFSVVSLLGARTEVLLHPPSKRNPVMQR